MLRKIHIYLISLVLMSCATYEVNYKNQHTFENSKYPEDKVKLQRFYLIGDTGYEHLDTVPPGILAFQKFADSLSTKEDKLIILGDNIYPAGMPNTEDKTRKQAEQIIDRQTQSLSFFDGDIHFIPGNHDWYADGIQSLEAQKERIEDGLKQQKKPWLPDPGCGMSFVDISDEVHLIILDSQWILTDWDEHPSINRNCDEIKTLEQFYAEFETELKKNQNKTTLVALHHPLYTNGIHGGNYTFSKHIFPTKSKWPLPVLGSLANLIRGTGGVSKQDAQNKHYRSMVSRISAIAGRWNRVVFASGHEHSLQYIEEESVKQIVSGSGSKRSYAKLGSNGEFVYPGYGFAVFDVFDDGSSWVQFYAADSNSPKLIFQKEVYEGESTFDIENLPHAFPATYTTSIYEKFPDERSDFYESIWGEHYRDLYSRPITLPVLDIDTAYGGLKPMRMGGGMQTNSLRLEDTLGRQYNMRQIKKNPIRLLQDIVYQDKNLTGEFDDTVVEKFLLDILTAAHPFAFLAVPDLSEAINVYHTNPKLFYIPKQRGLGKFNLYHGNEIYMLEERPEDHWMGSDIFGNPNHDIVSTADMIERLRRDEKYSLDEPYYLRARLLDMILGDWDRHEDQWRWSEFEDKAGNRTFRPVPRDRDQVFANFDGGFFGLIRTLTAFPNIYQPYTGDIQSLKWLNFSGLNLDRMIIRNATQNDWVREAHYIKKQLTDEVLSKAFSNFPDEISQDKTERIKLALQSRISKVEHYAEEYARLLNEIPILIATDKDDFIDVERLSNGKTRVSIQRNIQGERQHSILNKVYSEDLTDEIWIYGLDDEDTFTVTGRHKSQIKIRLIGGHDDDKYSISSGHKIRVYDHKRFKNTIQVNDGGRIIRTDDYNINTFDKDKRLSKTSSFFPRVGYNPDDGLLFGVQTAFTFKGFQRRPFTYQHQVSAGFYSSTGGFDMGYKGEFAHLLNSYNVVTSLQYTSPNYARNFFGIGNATVNRGDDVGRNYNRVKIRQIKAELGLKNVSKYGSTLEHKLSYQNFKIQRTSDRYIDDVGDNLISQNPNFFNSKNFLTYQSSFAYQNFDDSLNPSRGMDFKLEAGGTMNTSDADRHFFFLNPHLEFYNPLSSNKRWVLRSKVASQLIFNDTYEFYQGAILGADTGLRGYRRDRFIGQKSLVGNMDLRYTFNEVRTRVLPLQFTVFGGADVGRVWTDFPEPNRWHNDYGLGFSVNAADLLSGTFNFFHGADGFWFSFGFGAKF